MHEHPELTPARVGRVVRREWSVDINTADPVEVPSRAWHWVLGDDSGPQWLATVDPVGTSSERRSRLASYEAASQLRQRLDFVNAPVHTRDARIAVDVAAGLLLTLAPHLEGDARERGPLTDDADRGVAAAMAGELHRQPRPRQLPVWRPYIGRQDDQRVELERGLESDVWSGGPWSGPAATLVREARPALRQALRRFSLLGAAVAGSAERWVVTHGHLSGAHLVSTPDGERLGGWGDAALAPRERDLCGVLDRAEGNEPWFTYVEAGGSPDPLSRDTVELFTLEEHLSEIAEHVAVFSAPHDDGPDEQLQFGDLEAALLALVTARD